MYEELEGSDGAGEGQLEESTCGDLLYLFHTGSWDLRSLILILLLLPAIAWG